MLRANLSQAPAPPACAARVPGRTQLSFATTPAALSMSIAPNDPLWP
jgi:hypothetical protein